MLRQNTVIFGRRYYYLDWLSGSMSAHRMPKNAAKKGGL